MARARRAWCRGFRYTIEFDNVSESSAMNATSLNELRVGSESREQVDEKMHQIRQLLLGDMMQASEARIAELEAKVKELETSVGRRIDALSARLEALAGTTAADRRTALEELAKSFNVLSDSVRRISRA